MTVKALEEQIGRRAVVERIVRGGTNVEPHATTVLEANDDIVLAGPTAVIVAAKPLMGVEIDGEEIIRSIAGDVLDVLVNDSQSPRSRPCKILPIRSVMRLAAYSCGG